VQGGGSFLRAVWIARTIVEDSARVNHGGWASMRPRPALSRRASVLAAALYQQRRLRAGNGLRGGRRFHAQGSTNGAGNGEVAR
jgi:hypothetical protein